ncbi:FAFR256Cp [Eremothecium gossypii FDAG1]|nr:FAFR256Cp [Eremothecium gossypii FDAG1]
MSREDLSSTVERTPVKENAEEKRRLREEAFLASTPGWQPPSTRRRIELTRDPQKLRHYLRELSSVLVNVSESPVPSSAQAEPGTDAHAGNPAGQGGKIARGARLAQDVFGNLPPGYERKARRLNSSLPVVIQSASEDAPAVTLEGEPDMMQDLPAAGGPAAGAGTSSPQWYEQLDIGEMSEAESEASASERSAEAGSVARSLPLSLLRRLVGPTVDKGGYYLRAQALERVQQVAAELVQSLAQDLRRVDGAVVVDRSALVRIFANHGVLGGTAGNLELFRLCQRYLPLEVLNSMESALFGGD